MTMKSAGFHCHEIQQISHEYTAYLAFSGRLWNLPDLTTKSSRFHMKYTAYLHLVVDHEVRCISCEIRRISHWSQMSQGPMVLFFFFFVFPTLDLHFNIKYITSSSKNNTDSSSQLFSFSHTMNYDPPMAIHILLSYRIHYWISLSTLKFQFPWFNKYKRSPPISWLILCWNSFCHWQLHS